MRSNLVLSTLQTSQMLSAYRDVSVTRTAGVAKNSSHRKIIPIIYAAVRARTKIKDRVKVRIRVGVSGRVKIMVWIMARVRVSVRPANLEQMYSKYTCYCLKFAERLLEVC